MCRLVALFAQPNPAKDATERGQLFENIGLVVAGLGILIMAAAVVWAKLKGRKPRNRGQWKNDRI